MWVVPATTSTGRWYERKLSVKGLRSLREERVSSPKNFRTNWEGREREVNVCWSDPRNIRGAKPIRRNDPRILPSGPSNFKGTYKTQLCTVDSSKEHYLDGKKIEKVARAI